MLDKMKRASRALVASYVAQVGVTGAIYFAGKTLGIKSIALYAFAGGWIISYSLLYYLLFVYDRSKDADKDGPA